MNRSLKTLLVLVMMAIASVTAFAGGVLFERVFPTQLVTVVGQSERTDFSRTLDEVREKIEDSALEPSSEESMTSGAVRGLLMSIDDPYAAYFDEEHYQYFEEQADGEFQGIGVTVTERDGQVIVVNPIEGTPAEEAGLKSEDVIVSVDGLTRERWTLDEIVSLIRGPEGTDVTIGIRREDVEDILEFTISRAKIDIPNITTELVDGDLGYIYLFQFNAKAADEVLQAIEDLTADGARGFVLDLRDNPGGLLSSSIEVSSLFIEEGLVVSVEDRNGVVEEYRAAGDLATEVPLVVLVNENSASASEIVAGALQDHGRATIVGVTTFGKGSVQTIEQLLSGGAIKFTVARYLTPDGHSINKIGLEPDVVVEMDPEDQTEEEMDTQLERALEVLRGSL